MTNLQADPADRCFSRLVNVEKIKTKGLRLTIEANAHERENLADLLTIEAVDGLSFSCLLLPWKKGGVELSGQVTATVRQTCVVTLEVFSSEIAHDVKRYFDNPRPGPGSGRDKPQTPVLDLESIEDDVPDFIEDGVLDIGDIAAETLALCLSPYPRKPGAVFADHVESGPDEAESDNPFNVLQKLNNYN